MRFLLLSLITWIGRSKSIQQRAARTSRLKLWTGVTTLSLLDKVTWSGRYRPSLTGAETWPRPLQQPITVWHGSATSKASVDLAASYGDPLFSANVTNPIEPYAELIDYLLSEKQNRAGLELFDSDIAPVLRRLKGR